ncbi:MAG: hypothetical protein J1F64_10975 [Oscillospiraceae bacterium]|nr:hypothetical protein [Oscillospiraceae bacterium]
MILLIAGSRSITDYDLSPHIPADTDLIVSGGAAGVDELAERYADAHRISKLILRPRYDLYSRAAPIKRNAEMVEICDRVLIIWDGKSKGSKYTADYASKLGKPFEIITVSSNQE